MQWVRSNCCSRHRCSSSGWIRLEFCELSRENSYQSVAHMHNSQESKWDERRPSTSAFILASWLLWRGGLDCFQRRLLWGRIHYIQASVHPQRSVQYSNTRFYYSNVSSAWPVTVNSIITLKTSLIQDTNLTHCFWHCITPTKSDSLCSPSLNLSQLPAL